jgi:hypothetical protein
MTEQNVNRSENVVQVAGNVEINNRYGLAVHEVKELAHIFMRENFPVLREEAIAAAQANVQRFLGEFEHKLAQNVGRIDPNKFRDPDVQSSLNDAVLETAKKGNRSNSDLLAELVIERLNSASNDYVSLVVSEAIKVVPRLTPEQIGFLTLVLFMTSTKLNSAKSLNDFQPLASVVLLASRNSFGISESQKSHLAYTGCATMLQFMSNSAYSIWKANYDFLKDIADEELKKTIEKDLPVLHTLAKAFDDNQLGQITLTSVGKVIGLANLAKHIPGLEYKNWLG